MKQQLVLMLYFVFLMIGKTTGQGYDHSSLKAVLIVGHQEEGTRKAMNEMDEIASLLINNGIEVFKFYDDEADWYKIVQVARSCNFFIYSGHGSTLGEHGRTGGICINTMVSTRELLSTLRLKPNALIVFNSVCRGAGSSAGDDGDIGVNEAKNRVLDYSGPFFKVGASGYYANNYRSGGYKFLQQFLNGQPLQQVYKNSTKIWTDIEFETSHPTQPSMFYSIASSAGGGTATRITYTNGIKTEETIQSSKGYEIAYVGYPNFTIRDMR
jgi:hypothetical protein